MFNDDFVLQNFFVRFSFRKRSHHNSNIHFYIIKYFATLAFTRLCRVDTMILFFVQSPVEVGPRSLVNELCNKFKQIHLEKLTFIFIGLLFKRGLCSKNYKPCSIRLIRFRKIFFCQLMIFRQKNISSSRILYKTFREHQISAIIIQ